MPCLSADLWKSRTPDSSFAEPLERTLSQVQFLPQRLLQGVSNPRLSASSSKLPSFSIPISPHYETVWLTSGYSDALRRHEQVHKEPKRSTLGRGVRACLACAKARRKCSGDVPCSACENRSTACSYPHSSDSRSKSAGKSVGRDSMVSSDGQSAVRPQQSLEPSRVIASPERSSESWSNMSHSPVALDRSHDELNLSASEPHYDSDRNIMAAAPIETPAFPPAGHDGPPRTVHPQISLGSHTNILRQSSDMAAVTPLQPFLRDAMMDFQQEIGSETRQTWPPGGAASQPMSVDTNTDLPRTSEPDFWSQNALSSINWLPDNWIPDFNFNSGEPPPHNSFSGPPQTSENRSMSVADISSAASGFNGNTPTFNSDQGVTSPESAAQGVGYYYVDGDGARLPRVRKTPHRSPHQSSDSYTPLPGVDGLQNTHATFGFSRSDYGPQDGAPVPSIAPRQIPIEIYSKILHFFNQTCVTSTYFSPFNSGDFPSLEALDLFVRLYLEHFQPILPFIHPATFNISSQHWLLTLAMAAIGSHYVDIEDVDVLVVVMHEFLRRAINMVVSSLEDALV
jgi:hypothetical protein